MKKSYLSRVGHAMIGISASSPIAAIAQDAEAPPVRWAPTRRAADAGDAIGKFEASRRHYNEVRPHGAIGNKVPISLVNRSAPHGPFWSTEAV